MCLLGWSAILFHLILTYCLSTAACSCLTPWLYLYIIKVEELRRDLRIKSQELEAKNAAANDKLKKMVKDQQEAEKKKVQRIFFFLSSSWRQT